jgi:hypothetical protein
MKRLRDYLKYIKDSKVKYPLFLTALTGIANTIYRSKLRKDTETLKRDLIKVAGHLIPEKDISEMSRKELKNLNKILPPYMQKQT